MLRIFKSSINKIPNLGRWSRPNNKMSEEIKILLANYDSCGDKLCGTPTTLKKEIDEIVYKHKKK